MQKDYLQEVISSESNTSQDLHKLLKVWQSTQACKAGTTVDQC